MPHSWSPENSSSDEQLLPDFLTRDSDGNFVQLLFNSIQSAVLYLDKWGRVAAVNEAARDLFQSKELVGKTALEFLKDWDDPFYCHQEVLKVVRSGKSIFGAVERARISGEERWFHTDKLSIRDELSDINGVLLTFDDITQLKQSEFSLQQSESRYRSFVENSQDGIWRFDIVPPIPINQAKPEMVQSILDRAVLGDCNSVFANIFGTGNPEDLQGIKLDELGTRSYQIDAQTFVAKGFQLSTQEIAWRTRAGKVIYLQTSANGTIENNHLVEIWGVTRDTTERRRYIDRLEYQASHDQLTGLPNRSHLERKVNELIEEMQPDEKAALMIIDLDGFKEINDTLGHHVGDFIIKEIGPRVKRELVDVKVTIARLGGDEFAILLPNVIDERHAISVADRIQTAIRREFQIDTLNIELRASIGLALLPEQANDYSTLMRYADVAMYTAKQASSSVEVYDSVKDMHSPQRLSLMNELGKAIREGGLSLYYQPKIDLITQEVVGVEALSRWIHPEMGFVSPAEFVPIAEMTDMINDMTDWVLDESLRQVKLWQQKGLNLKVAVNISARNLLNESILERIEWLLHRYNLAPSCLELEITESTIMNNPEHSLRILEEINNLGIDLSIDDFGTGYSSLAYLKKLPVKWLKIDYSFIINMMEDEQDQIIVGSTVNMAHNLGLNVVAEGVENQELLERLTSMGCEHAQGYHIGKPVPPDDFEDWFNHYNQRELLG